MDSPFESLGQQVESLRAALAQEQQLRSETELRYERLFQRIPAIVHSLNSVGQIIAVSDHWLAAMGYTREEIIGRRSTDFLTPECRVDVQTRSLPAFMVSGYCYNEPYQMVTRTGEVIEGLLSATAEYDNNGVIVRTLALVADITDLTRKEAALRASEQERLSLQRATIDAQEQAIRELSTPVLNIAEGVLVMPLIGAVNAQRATHILEALLISVAQQQAETLILDITGLNRIDADVADLLVRGTRAARLLGARVMLTGIGPDIARVMVNLDLRFDEVPTFSSLRRGIDAALRPAHNSSKL